MTSGPDIFRAAKLMLDQHGENAPFSDQLVAPLPGRSRGVFICQSVFDCVHYAQ